MIAIENQPTDLKNIYWLYYMFSLFAFSEKAVLVKL